MKGLLFPLLTAVWLSPSPEATTAAGQPANGLVLTMGRVSRSGELAVQLGNVTGRPIKIFTESNSWGRRGGVSYASGADIWKRSIRLFRETSSSMARRHLRSHPASTSTGSLMSTGL